MYQVKIITETYSHVLEREVATYLNEDYKIQGMSKGGNTTTVIMVKEKHEPIQKQASETIR